jgi:hypothetical protein
MQALTLSAVTFGAVHVQFDIMRVTDFSKNSAFFRSLLD